MKIRISDLGPDGLKASGTIPVGNLNARMSEGRGTDITFISDPQISVHVQRTVSGAYTKGTIKARVKQPCARCIEEKEHEIELPADFVFQHRTLEENTEYGGETDTYFDDVGVNYFSGEHIDLEDVVQESLILSLSPYWRPPEDRNHACTLCGKKVEPIRYEEKAAANSFGQLLKNAGVR
ncbi:MAG: DUF177 domain-containing protein [Deltaproteobacteria bacterium]|nr:DUF177 domain-containing protein [Deltaproteobacteria bacterium]